MTIAIKNDNKMPLVVPQAARRKAGFKSGQVLEVKASGGGITILPKLPNADDEYTPGQRKTVDAQLAEGLADMKAGRTHGPFDTHEEMITFLHAQAKKAGARAKRPKTA